MCGAPATLFQKKFVRGLDVGGFSRGRLKQPSRLWKVSWLPRASARNWVTPMASPGTVGTASPFVVARSGSAQVRAFRSRSMMTSNGDSARCEVPS